MFEGSKYAYYGMYLIGFAIMMIVNLKTYKKYSLTKKTTVILTLITYVAGVAGAMIMGNLYSTMVAKYDTVSTVAIFGAVFFTPIFMSVASIIMCQSWRRVMDLLAPGIFIILACAKFGCFMAGCCPGRECSFGIYNPILELKVFPSQLFESITMAFVVAFCFYYAFKSKKCISGSVYPVTAAIYSVTRFAWEFMRYYPAEEMRHMMLGMTFWQFWCVTIILLSIVWIVILRSTKLIAAEEKAYALIGGKYAELGDKINKFRRRNKKDIVHHDKNKKKYKKK